MGEQHTLKITTEAIVVCVAVAAAAFYVGRETAMPPVPQTYDDCMLEGAKTAANVQIMSAVYAACVGKFGKPNR